MNWTITYYSESVQAMKGRKMLTHKELKARALARIDVKAEYDRIGEEVAVFDEFLKVRADAGITQAEVAERIGTTQSAIARLESGRGKHSPSLATLRKYARALGYRLEFRLVKEKGSHKTECLTSQSTRTARKRAAG